MFLFKGSYIKIHVFSFDLQTFYLHSLRSVNKCVVAKTCQSKAKMEKLAVLVRCTVPDIYTYFSELSHRCTADPSTV